MKRIFCVIMLLALILCSCTKTQEKSASVIEESSSSSIVEDEKPYNLEGLVLFENSPSDYDIVKTAYIPADAHTEQGLFGIRWLYDLGSGKMVAVCSFSRENGEEDNLLYAVDMETGKITASRDMGSSFSISYLKQNNDLLWYWADTDISSAVAFDYKLEEVKTAEIPWDDSVCFADDGSCWYLEEGKLVHNLLEDSETQAYTYENLDLMMLSGIFTDGKHLYGKLSGTTDDGDMRELMAELDTGDTVFSEFSEDRLVEWHIDNETLISSGSWKLSLGNWKLICSGGEAYSYFAPGYEMLDVVWSRDNYILFSSEDSDSEGNRSLILWLYDSVNGNLKGMTRLYLENNDAALDSSICRYTDGSLLLSVLCEDYDTESYDCTMYRWYPDDEHTNGIEPLHVEKSEFKELPSLAYTQNDSYWDPETYVPGPVSPKLEKLKKRAEVLGEKLGVNILIGDECRMVANSYAFMPTDDFDSISSILDMLETESAKYPAGFFSQIAKVFGEIDICITDSIKGLENNTIDSALGLSTVTEDKMIIAINTGPGAAHTFHHEIAHCIDRYINSDSSYKKLFDSEWNKLNPSGFSYLNSYAKDIPEDVMKYAYSAGYSHDSYFIDLYAMAYSTEDRARIMEYLMTDDSTVDIDSCPNIQNKINYYAECIRDRFDTSTWGKLYWEKYLNS